MAYVDTVEAQRAGRNYIKQAMRVPLLETGRWPTVGATMAMKTRFIS